MTSRSRCACTGPEVNHCGGFHAEGTNLHGLASVQVLNRRLCPIGAGRVAERYSLIVTVQRNVALGQPYLTADAQTGQVDGGPGAEEIRSRRYAQSMALSTQGAIAHVRQVHPRSPAVSMQQPAVTGREPVQTDKR